MKTSRLTACMIAIASSFITEQATAQAAPPVDAAQTGQSQPAAPVFSKEELDAMLAPIALYPDALLSQVLMASTYPLEIVQASRWSKSNGDKGGESAANMVADQSWDASVKSLVAFPKVLHMMNDQLEWTQKVGDAFLGQQDDVMESIQRLRVQAQKAGNLSSNEQQTVVTQGDSIVIQPAQPQIIYVPAYNPTVVYGTWPYPSYPPTYYPGVASWYPGQSFVNGLMWGTGVAAAGAIFGSFNWGSRSVDINVNNYNRYSKNNFYNTTNNRWRHDPQHRGAVAYRDQASRQQFSKRVPGADAREEFRGRANLQDGQRAQLADRRPDGIDRSKLGDKKPDGSHRAQLADKRPELGTQGPKGDAIQQKAQEHRATPKGDAFKGVDTGRQQIDRGKASLASASRPQGGLQQGANRGGDRPQINRGGGDRPQINRGGGGGGGRPGRNR